MIDEYNDIPQIKVSLWFRFILRMFGGRTVTEDSHDGIRVKVTAYKYKNAVYITKREVICD